MKKIFANNAKIRDMYLSSEGIDDFLQTLNVIKGSPQQSTILDSENGMSTRRAKEKSDVFSRASTSTIVFSPL